MKTRCFLLHIAFLALVAFTSASTYSQTVVTFDGLNETGSGSWFSLNYQGYHGLIWNNILCNNAILETGVLAGLSGTGLSNGLTGDFYGMVSSSNVAIMIGGNELPPNSEIDSPGTNFDFFSAYLTGREDSNLNIEVQGFRDTNLVYDQTVVASATNATLFTFNFLDIDRLYFSSYGGEAAFGTYSDPGTFIMDNFTFDFIPEPSSLLLTGLATVSLAAFLRSKRA